MCLFVCSFAHSLAHSFDSLFLRLFIRLFGLLVGLPAWLLACLRVCSFTQIHVFSFAELIARSYPVCYFVIVRWLSTSHRNTLNAPVAANDGKPCNSQRFGTVAFGEDESALGRSGSPGVVSILCRGHCLGTGFERCFLRLEIIPQTIPREAFSKQFKFLMRI